MDEFLNELYGTSQIISGDDVEKQAAAEFLVKLAEQEGVDLDTLSDAEVGDLLAEIEKKGSAQAQPQAEAQEKLAEADFLGRAMAHAYVNELHEIEKSAARPSAEVGKEVLRQGKGALGRLKEWAGIGKIQRGLSGRTAGQAESSAADKLRQRMITGQKTHMMSPEMAQRYGQAAGSKAKAGKEMATKGTRELVSGAGQLGKRVILPAAAVGTGAALLSNRGKTVQSSDAQFEEFARQRAMEMLAEAGYDTEKVAEAELSQALDGRALQMLEQAGYPVQWG